MLYIVTEHDLNPVDYHSAKNDIVYVTTKQPTDLDGNDVSSGELGTNNNTLQVAHGEFPTIEEAVAKAKELSEGGEELDSNNSDDIVTSFLIGKGMVSREAAVNWCYPITDEITSQTTDEEIEELIDVETSWFEENENKAWDTDYLYWYFKDYRDQVAENE